jgi:bisphosphoglycerate-independent phosphoglycerate mutase (AlkP superfamily)
MHGPGVTAGRSMEKGHILDLAPTILEHLGVAPPEYMAGRAWHTAIAAE